jgi:hypothetical protein
MCLYVEISCAGACVCLASVCVSPPVHSLPSHPFSPHLLPRLSPHIGRRPQGHVQEARAQAYRRAEGKTPPTIPYPPRLPARPRYLFILLCLVSIPLPSALHLTQFTLCTTLHTAPARGGGGGGRGPHRAGAGRAVAAAPADHPREEAPGQQGPQDEIRGPARQGERRNRCTTLWKGSSSCRDPPPSITNFATPCFLSFPFPPFVLFQPLLLSLDRMPSPQQFLDSEVDLDETIKRLGAIAASPELYPDLAQLPGGVPTLVALLAHE